MPIETEYGKAHINSQGYLVIHTVENHMKYLHRLIYEDFYKVSLLSSAIIHHKDGNKLNNSIENLELIDRVEHNKIHHKNKINSKQTIEKMRNSKLGKNNPRFGKGSSGYYRVYKRKCSQCKQGFCWIYEYPENGKSKVISRVNINELEKEVKNRGLPWLKIREVLK